MAVSKKSIIRNMGVFKQFLRDIYGKSYDDYLPSLYNLPLLLRNEPLFYPLVRHAVA